MKIKKKYIKPVSELIFCDDEDLLVTSPTRGEIPDIGKDTDPDAEELGSAKETGGYLWDSDVDGWGL